MASSLSISSYSTIIDSRAPLLRQVSASSSSSSPYCVSLPPPHIRRSAKACSFVKRRSVVMRSTGEAPTTTTTTTTIEEETTELPEIVKTTQQAWAKVDDKYAIGTLGFAALVALWGSTGLISAIDRLPLVPGVLELVGIGYSGWFTYKNLIFKPDREVLLEKINDTYKDILGSS
ncbi:unnamed protein product [Cochlearia groenlandica]